MADQALIKLDGVKKVFQTDEVETHALEGIHLDIQRGEYVAIAGPSGCGKSTLLSIFGLLETPTDGEYWLNNRPVAKLTMRERARTRNREIGFIFQNFNLIGDLTVFDNVELPLTYRGMPWTGGSGSSMRSNASGWRTEPDIIPVNYPEVSSSAWPWLAPWAAIRPSFLPTSRRGISTPGTANR